MAGLTPLGLVASMRLDNGERWGDRATPEQWADMRVLLSQDRPRWHFWLRSRGRSKPLALSTPLPTMTGWTTMGDVRAGDRLLDEAGSPCTVTHVGPVLGDEDCWRVTFDDGTHVVASGSHEWAAEDHRARGWRSRRGMWSPHMRPGGVSGLPLVTTREIAARLRTGPRGDLSWSVPLARPWDLPDASLPLPPYVLGLWLGDGGQHTGSVTVGDDDIAHVTASFAALGYPLSSPARKPGANCATWRFGQGEGERKNGRGPRIWNSTRILGEMGLIKNKHVPAAYLRASAAQRLELLRGMMDSDGHVASGRAVYNSTSRVLADGAAELIVSLGWKARISQFTAKLNGKDCGPCWKVSFRPDVSPFTLARKTGRMRFGDQGQASRHASRMVVSVERVPSEPVRCISVDAPSHLYLAGRAAVPTHNTFDAGAATLAVMLTGVVRAGDELYAAAEDRTQAGLLAEKIRAIAQNTPELAGSVEIQQFRVITPRTGAVLNVLSSELAGSWGKTPRWLFVDEVCNHTATSQKREFVTALVTALLKRADSQCLIGSTPSAQSHWAYDLWLRAVESRLWRASIVKGPAPWQDPEELADERRYLPDFMWRRLFECEWAAADDVLADEAALADCTRAGNDVLYPVPGASYVVTWDIGWKKDHSAVAVMHVEDAGDRKRVIVDRLESWVPAPGREVDIGAVLDFAAAASLEYNGAPLEGDIYQSYPRVQDLRQAGYLVTAAKTTAGDNSTRAKLLLRLIRERSVSLPDDPVLRKEMASLRLAEGATPGIVRLVTDGSSEGHYDRAMAIMYGAGHLLSRNGQSWRNYCGDLRQCETCGNSYIAASRQCKYCHAANPGQVAREALAVPEIRPAGPVPVAAAPGSWAAAYLPADAVRCPAGHVYSGGEHASCPRCSGYQPGAMPGVPAAFTRALALPAPRHVS